MKTGVKRLCLALLLLALVAVFAFRSSPQPVLIVHSTSTKIYPADSDSERPREYGVAELELVNRARYPITYLGRGEGDVECAELYKTDKGWEEWGSFCGFGLEKHQLQPGNSIRFQALFQLDRPCKAKVYWSKADDNGPPDYVWKLSRWAGPVISLLYRRPSATTGPITFASRSEGSPVPAGSSVDYRLQTR